MRSLVTAVLVVLANDLLIAAFVLPEGEIALVGFAAITLVLPLYALASRAKPEEPMARKDRSKSPGRQTTLSEF